MNIVRSYSVILVAIVIIIFTIVTIVIIVIMPIYDYRILRLMTIVITEIYIVLYSIRNKSDFINQFIIDSKCDIVAITETWLTDNDSTIPALLFLMAII